MITTLIAFLLKNWKIFVIGLAIIAIVGYIGILKIENSHLEGTIKELRVDIENKQKLLDNQDQKIAGYEASIEGYQNQITKLNETHKKFVKNMDKIYGTLDAVNNVSPEQIQGVVPRETSDKLIDIYNDIFAPFRKQ